MKHVNLKLINDIDNEILHHRNMHECYLINMYTKTLDINQYYDMIVDSKHAFCITIFRIIMYIYINIL